MIYFLQTACSVGFIKIGWTTCIQSRLSSIQTGSPYAIKVLLIIPGDQARERRLHRQFQNSRERFEWFRPTPELLAYIEDCRPDDLGPDPTPEATPPNRSTSMVRAMIARRREAVN